MHHRATTRARAGARATRPRPCKAGQGRATACAAAALRPPAGRRDRARAARDDMSFIIERVTSPADLDAVLEIEDASFVNPTSREWYESELQRPDVCFIYVIRTAEHRVAGFCAFWKVVDQIHINNLAVRPELRRAGIGRLLLDRVLDEAATIGAPHATLEV